MLPNFLIIGAPKGGTTWLYSRLRRHPDVFMPSVKELGYFSHREPNSESSSTFETKDRNWYEDHFRNTKDESAVGEATPNYLLDTSAPGRICEIIPNVRLVACLRYPTARVWSHYWMAHGMEYSIPEFDRFIKQRDNRALQEGRYGEQLDRYLSLFDRDQLLVLIHEEVFSDPSLFLNQICSFLGVNDTFYQNQPWIAEAENRSSATRSILLRKVIGATATWMRHHVAFRKLLDVIKKVGIANWVKQANRRNRTYPEVPKKVRTELDEYYEPTIQRVEKIIGRRIDAWRD